MRGLLNTPFVALSGLGWIVVSMLLLLAAAIVVTVVSLALSLWTLFRDDWQEER